MISHKFSEFAREIFRQRFCQTTRILWTHVCRRKFNGDFLTTKVFAIHARLKKKKIIKSNKSLWRRVGDDNIDAVSSSQITVTERWRDGIWEAIIMWHFVRKLKTFNRKAFSIPPRRISHAAGTKTIGTFVILQPSPYI